MPVAPARRLTPAPFPVLRSICRRGYTSSSGGRRLITAVPSGRSALGVYQRCDRPPGPHYWYMNMSDTLPGSTPLVRIPEAVDRFVDLICRIAAGPWTKVGGEPDLTSLREASLAVPCAIAGVMSELAGVMTRDEAKQLTTEMSELWDFANEMCRAKPPVLEHDDRLIVTCQDYELAIGHPDQEFQKRTAAFRGSLYPLFAKLAAEQPAPEQPAPVVQPTRTRRATKPPSGAALTTTQKYKLVQAQIADGAHLSRDMARETGIDVEEVARIRDNLRKREAKVQKAKKKAKRRRPG